MEVFTPSPSSLSSPFVVNDVVFIIVVVVVVVIVVVVGVGVVGVVELVDGSSESLFVRHKT